LVDRPSAQVWFRSRVHDLVFWLTILQACELSRAEMMASVPAFLDKLAHHRPRFVCFVGMIIWEIVRNSLVKLQQQGTVKRVEKGKSKEKSQMGLQTYKLIYGDARGMFLGRCMYSLRQRSVFTSMRYLAGLPQKTFLFVVPCTSGRVVQYQVCSTSRLALPLHNKHLVAAF